MSTTVISRRTTKRIGTAAAVLLAMAVAPQVADAAPTGAPQPTVTAAGLPGSITTMEQCDGRVLEQSGSAMLKIDRGLTNTSGNVSVDVTYGGSLVAGTDYDALPDPVEIPAGQNATFLEVHANKPGDVTVTIEAGQGYTVGSPATATAETVHDNLDEVCHPVVEETISVGQKPTFLDPTDLTPVGGAIYDANFAVEGTLPTGMSVDGSLFTGVATTPGVYEYTFTYCLGDACALEVPYRTTVVVDQLVPPVVEAPAPATPIQNTANYTG